MNKDFISSIAIILIAFSVMHLSGSSAQSANEASNSKPLVYLLDIDGTINPALADYITKGIETAQEANAACVVIRMDTPGGVLSTTKTIIKEIMNARVPVVVYVAPSGSSATSAGALIAVCADVAAMAPGTNIGAAHPVSGGGQEIDSAMSEKIMNDMTAYIRGIVLRKGRNAEWAEKAIRDSVSITATEALNLNVINLIADSVPDLLEKLDGMKIEKDNRNFVLKTKGARLERIVPGMRFRILDVIANPNVAYVLMMIGGLGIMMELYNPGLIFPGVAGAICLLLSFFALQVLPVNYVGILLMLLSIIFFVLELKVQSFGLLSLGAIISLTLGSVMLFDSTEVAMRVSWAVIIPTVSAVSAFFIVVMGLVVKAWISKPMTGQQGLIGEVGSALTDINPTGKIALHGEYWNARSQTMIPKGVKVKVRAIRDLEVTVDPYDVV